MTHIGTLCDRKRDSLNRDGTQKPISILKKITKVIFPGTDERGGCKKALPEDLETRRRNEAAGTGQGVQEGVESHGPRCIE